MRAGMGMRMRKLPAAGGGGLILLLVLALALLPYLPIFHPQRGDPWITAFILANYLAVFAMSWDILSGYTGQISFGQAFFIGAAGYTGGLANVGWGWPLFLSIPLGIFVAVLLGLLVGLPTLRLRGAYLALVTLFLPILGMKLVSIERFAGITGGGLGRAGLTPLAAVALRDFNGNGRIDRADILLRYAKVQRIDYYYSLGLMVLVACLLLWLARSKVGKVFEAIREDEEAVEAAGINTAKYKILAFLISSGVAGLGGAFYAHYWQSLVPSEMLSLDLSLKVIIAAVFGGMGTILGPILGAYSLILGKELLLQVLPFSVSGSLPAGWTSTIFLALLLLVLRFARRGVLPMAFTPFGSRRRRGQGGRPSLRP
ncbi:TPA: branched-chain amino acid ABC transporter permease [Candidatus Bipolaricaulota bacterium]|nr:branched-chain amino acid ABC transporter permease [Candidatus Bipolaricaulota bacterium]